MYTQILNHSLRKIDDSRERLQLSTDLKQVTGSIVVLSEALSITALANLLAVKKEKL